MKFKDITEENTKSKKYQMKIKELEKELKTSKNKSEIEKEIKFLKMEQAKLMIKGE